uniref:Uncharacterized protein n=1 Tax=Rhizophora mucronata TaxID=61149 RepID=A0A2P2Q4A9_RHIMU
MNAVKVILHRGYCFPHSFRFEDPFPFLSRAATRNQLLPPYSPVPNRIAICNPEPTI